MKPRIIALAAAALLALGSTQASAHSDVRIGVSLGIPAPVVVERYPAYHYDYGPAPAYYYDEPARVYYYDEPRYEVRHYESRKGKHKHRWHKHKHRHH